MGNQAKTQYISIKIILSLWPIFASLYILLKNSVLFEKFAGILLSIAVIGSIAIAFFYSFRVWQKAIGDSRLIFGFFALSLFCVLLYDIIYQGIFNILNTLHVTNLSFAYTTTLQPHIIYYGFLIFQLITWICLLPEITPSIKKWHDLIIYIPFLAVFLFILTMFIITFKLEMYVYQLSLFDFYRILYVFLGFSSFILAMLCLASAKHKGIFYMALGFLINKSGGLIMVFDTFGQKFGTGSPMETLWVLGCLVMAYGLINFKETETYNTSPQTWIYPINSVRTQISIWIFALFTFSAFICFGIHYLARPAFLAHISKDLRVLFPMLRLYAIITLILSKFLADHVSLLIAKKNS